MRCWSPWGTGPPHRPRSRPRSPSAWAELASWDERRRLALGGLRAADQAQDQGRDLAVAGLRRTTDWLRSQLDGALGDGDPGPVVIPPPLPLPRPFRIVAAIDALDGAEAAAGTADAAATEPPAPPGGPPEPPPRRCPPHPTPSSTPEPGRSARWPSTSRGRDERCRVQNQGCRSCPR